MHAVLQLPYVHMWENGHYNLGLSSAKLYDYLTSQNQIKAKHCGIKDNLGTLHADGPQPYSPL
jgi:hypothetical protein